MTKRAQMKQQTSLSMTGFFDKGKKTRREQFLAEMDQVVPWARLCAVIFDASSSTKNAQQKRDTEMHQSRKGTAAFPRR